MLTVIERIRGDINEHFGLFVEQRVIRLEDCAIKDCIVSRFLPPRLVPNLHSQLHLLVDLDAFVVVDESVASPVQHVQQAH